MTVPILGHPNLWKLPSRIPECDSLLKGTNDIVECMVPEHKEHRHSTKERPKGTQNRGHPEESKVIVYSFIYG